jgi:hypothetical protein
VRGTPRGSGELQIACRVGAPHLCGGRSASALRENNLESIMRFSAGQTTFRKPALYKVEGDASTVGATTR